MSVLGARVEPRPASAAWDGWASRATVIKSAGYAGATPSLRAAPPAPSSAGWECRGPIVGGPGGERDLDRSNSGLREMIGAMRHSAGRDGVGVASGGRRNVECALRELHALGVRSWAEPVPDHQRDPLDMERFNVFVDPEDRDTAHEWWIGGSSPALREASDADRREHRERVRQERPNIEVWFEDVAYEDFVQALGRRMTVEQAMDLRQFIVEGPTFRALARWAQDRFTDEWRLGSLTPGHQAVGIALCQVAAEKLGEDPKQDPWV